MISKKFSLIALIAIIAVTSTIYGVYETTPTIHRYSIAQFSGESFEEFVHKNHLVVVGKITGVGLEITYKEVMGTDEQGNEYLVEKVGKPNAAVTIRVLEVLKDDNILNNTKSITFLDPEVNGELGKIGGQTAMFHSKYAIDYQVGDTGIFMIHKDRGIYSMGFGSYYPIIEGQTTITTELDKLVGKIPIDLEHAENHAENHAKNTARALGQK